MWLDNFNKMRQESGMSLDELSQKSGVPKGTLAKITAGITRAPTLENMRSLVHAMGYTLAELDDNTIMDLYSSEERNLIKKYRILDVHGKRVVEGALSLEYDRMTHVVERKETGNVTYITLYDLAYSAGLGEPMDNPYYRTKLELPTERVPDNAHCCVKVNGDSMEPAYYSGDIVFVQRQDEFIREGEIGIFVLNGEGYIKKLGDRELVSLNPNYEPIEIHEFDDLRCQGRVLGKL